MTILATNISFAAAIIAAKNGGRIRRAGWNGKGMWVCKGEGNDHLPTDKFWNRHTRALADANGGFAVVQPYMIMRTAAAEVQMGWLASQSDMLADDWELLADDEAY